MSEQEIPDWVHENEPIIKDFKLCTYDQEHWDHEKHDWFEFTQDRLILIIDRDKVTRTVTETAHWHTCKGVKDD